MQRGMVCSKLYKMKDFQVLLPSNLLRSHQTIMKRRLVEKMKAELNPVIVKRRQDMANTRDME